jgi:tetratricopeptide (TPR) repeat protein
MQVAQRFPNNFLLASAQAHWHDAREMRAEERRAAEQAVRCSINNPYAWINLAGTIYNEANQVRQERTYQGLNTQERAFVSGLYAQWQRVAARATTLDARNSEAWLQVSLAAAFSGRGAPAAEAALTKAFALDKANLRAYQWGLQLYQPKWGATRPVGLLVQQIQADSRLFPLLYDKVNSALHSVGMTGEAQTSVERSIALFQQAARRNPQDIDAFYKLGLIMGGQSRYVESFNAFRAVLRLKPTSRRKNAVAAFKVGEAIHYRDWRPLDAEPLYRQAMAFDRTYPDPINATADIRLHVRRDAPGAERLYRQCIAMKPDDWFFHANLARCLLMQGREDAAVKEARRASALGAAEHPVFRELGIWP